MNQRAQTAIEFIILMGSMIIVFLVFLSALQVNVGTKSRENINGELKKLAYYIQDEIDLASLASEGYKREFDIPQKIHSLNYTLQVINQTLYIKTQNEKYALAVPLAPVTGTVNQGKNTIEKRNNSIYLNS